METETDAVEERVTVLEKTIPEEGVINASSVTADTISGKITNVLTYRLTKDSSQACTRPLIRRSNSTGATSGTVTFDQYLFSDLIPGHVVGDETVSCTLTMSGARNSHSDYPSLYTTLIVDDVTYVSSFGGAFTSGTTSSKSTTVNLPIAGKAIQLTMSSSNAYCFASISTRLSIDENIYIASTL